MQKAHGHMTAAAVHAELCDTGRKVSAATVYRQLEKLVEEGVAVKSVPAGEKSACFELLDHGACEPRRCYHMKCTSCGKLIHLDCDEIDRLCAHMLDHHGFHVDMSTTVLFGTCKECAAAANAVEPAQKTGEHDA